MIILSPRILCTVFICYQPNSLIVGVGVVANER